MKPDHTINGRYFVDAEVSLRKSGLKEILQNRHIVLFYTDTTDQSLPLGKCFVELEKWWENNDDVYKIKLHEGKAVVLTELPEKEFNLQFCEKCIQMTNHIDNNCMKCSIKQSDDELAKEIKTNREQQLSEVELAAKLFPNAKPLDGKELEILNKTFDNTFSKTPTRLDEKQQSDDELSKQVVDGMMKLVKKDFSNLIEKDDELAEEMISKTNFGIVFAPMSDTNRNALISMMQEYYNRRIKSEGLFTYKDMSQCWAAAYDKALPMQVLSGDQNVKVGNGSVSQTQFRNWLESKKK